MVEIAQNLFSTRRGSVLVGAAVVVAGLLAIPSIQHKASSRAQTQSSVWDRNNTDVAASPMNSEVNECVARNPAVAGPKAQPALNASL